MTLPIQIRLLTSGIRTVANLARQTRIERTRLNRALNGDLRLRSDEQVRVAAALQMPVTELSTRLLAERQPISRI